MTRSTRPFLFRRESGANDTLSLDGLQARLGGGIQGLDVDVIEAFASLLAAGDYMLMLLVVAPCLVRPVEQGDYFAEEQVATWGMDSFWGLPGYPRTPYHRTFETPVDAEAHLFEFVVPLVPPSWNEPDRVNAHRRRLASGSQVAAVAVSTLDVCLDGHHGFQAAAEAGARLQL